MVVIIQKIETEEDFRTLAEALKPLLEESEIERPETTSGYYTIEEVSQLLRKSIADVKREVKTGNLEIVRVDRCVRFPKSQFDGQQVAL